MCLFAKENDTVPGDGGSQVDAKINKSSVVHYGCQKVSEDYFNLWLNMELLVPYVIDCFVRVLKLRHASLVSSLLENYIFSQFRFRSII